MKKITLYDFLALPEQKQYQIVFNSGECIDIRIEGARRFLLFAVGMFFVEVEYDKEQNKIINNRPFITGDILDKYTIKLK